MLLSINLDNNIEDLKKIKAGTSFKITGKIYTARDAAHKKIKEYFDGNKQIPLSFKNSIIYYMGPTPAREGYPIGSCGPTSSYRMDDYLETTLKLGVVATIGKGERKKAIVKLIKKYKAPYLLTIGGAAAYLAECVISSKIVLFKELQTEAVRELIVKDFPVIVGIDVYGNNIFNRV